MNNNKMNSMQRVLTTLSHKEPDKVPLFLLPTMHGAKELGLSIKEYFSSHTNVFEGQTRLRNKFNNDCLSNLYYAAIEVEAWGGEVIFRDDGPPNSGAPIIKQKEDILNLQPPKINDSPCLLKVLETTKMFKESVNDTVPIIGVAISPFSLPVMQMGFEKYIELIYEQPDLFARLMQLNEAYCTEWANAQLEMGATAIVYFDPVSSTTIIPKEIFMKTGYEIAKRRIASFNGPAAVHYASGRCSKIFDEVISTGAAAVGVSAEDNLIELKQMSKGKISLVGNMNGIEMMNWSKEDAVINVKEIIAKAGRGGGFILSDNHGEIPWQISDDVIYAISEAVDEWGKYPLNWIDDYDG